MNLHDVIERPIVTEKSAIAREASQRRDLPRSTRRRRSTTSGARSSSSSPSRSQSVRTMQQQGKKKRVGKFIGRRPTWKKAIVRAGPGPVDRVLRGSLIHAGQEIQTDFRRPTQHERLGLRRAHARPFRAFADEGARRQVRRPQRQRSHHDLSPRRWPQAALSPDRLPAQQDRRAGPVAAIDYDPNRSANIALLHYVDGEKRYILAPERAQGR